MRITHKRLYSFLPLDLDCCCYYYFQLPWVLWYEIEHALVLSSCQRSAQTPDKDKHQCIGGILTITAEIIEIIHWNIFSIFKEFFNQSNMNSHLCSLWRFQWFDYSPDTQLDCPLFNNWNLLSSSTITISRCRCYYNYPPFTLNLSFQIICLLFFDACHEIAVYHVVVIPNINGS